MEGAISCGYIYDAFICYAYEDKDWVELFVSHLESSPYKLRCCNHDRDFEVGKTTIANIDKHLAASKKFILIITNAFNNSEWCEYERDIILSLSIFEKKRTIISVILEECHIPKSLSIITYVTVTDNFAGFWFDKIIKALDIDALLCSVCFPEGYNRTALTRCPECKAAFCHECNVQHTRMPGLKTHQTADLSKYVSNLEQVAQFKDNYVELQNPQFKVRIWPKLSATTNRAGYVEYTERSFEETLKEIEFRLSALEKERKCSIDTAVEEQPTKRDTYNVSARGGAIGVIGDHALIPAFGSYAPEKMKKVHLPHKYSLSDLDRPAAAIKPLSSGSSEDEGSSQN